MATTLKDTTIAASYADLMKRQASYSATGSRVEIMDDAGVGKDTSIYLEEDRAICLEASATGDLSAVCSYEELDDA